MVEELHMHNFKGSDQYSRQNWSHPQEMKDHFEYAKQESCRIYGGDNQTVARHPSSLHLLPSIDHCSLDFDPDNIVLLY